MPISLIEKNIEFWKMVVRIIKPGNQRAGEPWLGSEGDPIDPWGFIRYLIV